MDNETLIKFLEFLKTECLRHQNDKIITDDEILKYDPNKTLLINKFKF